MIKGVKMQGRYLKTETAKSLSFGQTRRTTEGSEDQKYKKFHSNHIESFWDPQNIFYFWSGVLQEYIQILRKRTK